MCAGIGVYSSIGVGSPASKRVDVGGFRGASRRPKRPNHDSAQTNRGSWPRDDAAAGRGAGRCVEPCADSGGTHGSRSALRAGCVLPRPGARDVTPALPTGESSRRGANTRYLGASPSFAGRSIAVGRRVAATLPTCRINLECGGARQIGATRAFRPKSDFAVAVNEGRSPAAPAPHRRNESSA